MKDHPSSKTIYPANPCNLSPQLLQPTSETEAYAIESFNQAATPQYKGQASLLRLDLLSKILGVCFSILAAIGIYTQVAKGMEVLFIAGLSFVFLGFYIEKEEKKAKRTDLWSEIFANFGKSLLPAFRDVQRIKEKYAQLERVEYKDGDEGDGEDRCVWEKSSTSIAEMFLDDLKKALSLPESFVEIKKAALLACLDCLSRCAPMPHRKIHLYSSMRWDVEAIDPTMSYDEQVSVFRYLDTILNLALPEMSKIEAVWGACEAFSTQESSEGKAFKEAIKAAREHGEIRELSEDPSSIRFDMKKLLADLGTVLLFGTEYPSFVEKYVFWSFSEIQRNLNRAYKPISFDAWFDALDHEEKDGKEAMKRTLYQAMSKIVHKVPEHLVFDALAGILLKGRDCGYFDKYQSVFDSIEK